MGVLSFFFFFLTVEPKVMRRSGDYSGDCGAVRHYPQACLNWAWHKTTGAQVTLNS